MQNRSQTHMENLNKMSLVGCDLKELPNSYTAEQILSIRNSIKHFDTEYKHQFMQLAIDEANTCLTHEDCGPFGACIVLNDIIVGLGHNKVVGDNDPTCHAEINCIRNACKFLKTYDLRGCVLYSSCEPCPMCLTACKWANIEKVYYANTQKDADKIGFRDQKFYDMFKDESYKAWCTHVDYADALYTFNKYAELNKTIY